MALCQKLKVGTKPMGIDEETKHEQERSISNLLDKMEGDKSVKNEMELGFIDSSKPMKELESNDDMEGHGMAKQPTQRNSPTIFMTTPSFCPSLSFTASCIICLSLLISRKPRLIT